MFRGLSTSSRRREELLLRDVHSTQRKLEVEPQTWAGIFSDMGRWLGWGRASSIVRRYSAKPAGQIGNLDRNHLRTERAIENRMEVALKGGLGNQLFGFALAVELRRRTNRPVHLYTGYLRRTNTVPELGPIISGKSQGISMSNDSAAKCLFREKTFRFDPEVTDISDSAIFDGYFQSPKYFHKSIDEIRRLILGPTGETREVGGSSGFIAVQLRRGDYLRPGALKFHGIAPSEYFLAGVSLLRKVVGHMPVVIFSDDQSAATQLSAGITRSKVHDPSGQTPIQVLRALAEAEAFCISNSTFGWWGAFASGGDKPVIVPRPWFRDDLVSSHDLVPRDWLAVGTAEFC